MTADVVVIDYGIGNLFSVQRALEHCGARVLVSSKSKDIMNASRIILPGVGAFANGMQEIVEKKIDSILRDYIKSGRPVLGICLGMQVLASSSTEFGTHEGLGIIPGEVLPIPETSTNEIPHKIPHIGWVTLEIPKGMSDWKNSIFRNIRPDDSVYLVHSYTVVPKSQSHRLADCHYNGRLISAAIRKENVYGCQFHPEKSGKVGLEILNQFLLLK